MSWTDSRAAVLFVTWLLLAAPALGAVSVAASSPGDRPDFAGVPNTNVQEDLPVGVDTTLTARQLRGSVMASDHAETLQVIVTTPERAEGYVGGAAVEASRGNVALVFQDEHNHSGRQVALPRSAIRSALGETPSVVHGVHESGDRWAADVTERNGLLFFEIPKFSSNSVTFSGEVSITGNPATDGSQWTYDLGTDESLSDPNVTFTGHTKTEWDNATAAGLADGDALAVNPAGNTEPRGPNSSEPEVILTGNGFENAVTESGTTAGGDASISPSGNLEPTGPSANNEPTLQVTGRETQKLNPVFGSDEGEIHWVYGHDSGYVNSEVRFDNPPDALSGVTVSYNRYSGGGVEGEYSVDVYVVEETPDGTYGEGTKVVSGWTPAGGAGSDTVQFDTKYEMSTTGDITVEFVTTNGPTGSRNVQGLATDSTGSGTWWTNNQGESTDDGGKIELYSQPMNVDASDGYGASASFGNLSDGETVTKEFDLSQDATTLAWSFSGGKVDWTLDYTEREATENPAVDLDGDGVNETAVNGLLHDGETWRYRASDLSLSDDTLTVSTDAGTTVDVAVNLEEVTKTRDPELTLNGTVVASYAGVLEDGATVDQTVSQDHLKAGQNNVSVAVGDGTLSNDAPTPSVGLDYDHKADVKIENSYVDNGWEESYNVSHTFAGDRENVEVTIPFSRTIYEVRNVEYQVNGNGWTSVSSSNWALKGGTTLVVTPPDTDGSQGYEAGDELEVRTSGYKVKPINGEVSITDPTDPSDSTVNAEFKVDNRTSDFYLELRGTKNRDRAHYLASASWARDETMVYEADGSRDLYLPNAEEGGAARVTTIPLTVNLESGDAGIHVVDPDTPTVQVRPGPGGVGSQIELAWHDVTSGETYELYSEDKGRQVDKDTAESPVFFSDDDDDEIFKIRLVSSDDSGGGSGDSQGGSWETSGPDTTLQEFGIVAGWAALVVVLIGATGRSELTGRRRWLVVGGVAGGTGLISFEVLRPGSVSGAINAGLQEVVALGGLAAIGVVVYSVVSWWQSRKAEASTPETKVELDVGGGSD